MFESKHIYLFFLVVGTSLSATNHHLYQAKPLEDPLEYPEECGEIEREFAFEYLLKKMPELKQWGENYTCGQNLDGSNNYHVLQFTKVDLETQKILSVKAVTNPNSVVPYIMKERILKKLADPTIKHKGLAKKLKNEEEQIKNVRIVNAKLTKPFVDAGIVVQSKFPEISIRDLDEDAAQLAAWDRRDKRTHDKDTQTDDSSKKLKIDNLQVPE